MNWEESARRLKLDHDPIVNNQVGSVCCSVDQMSLVLERQCQLRLEWQLAQTEFDFHARLVRGFEQPWSQVAVDVDRCANYVPCEVIGFE
jgi:hypothetical protein